MATNRKRIPRSRLNTGLTGAEEMFILGRTQKQVNQFEMLDLEYPNTTKTKAKIENLKRVKIG